MNTPPPLRKWGQNFLVRPDVAARIARAGGPADAPALEIGPGRGALSQALLDAQFPIVAAVERDLRLAPALAALRARDPRFVPAVADATCALAEAPARAHRIVANLPFNVASPLLVARLEAAAWPPAWLSLTALVQREVAARIVARPGERAWGRLGALAAWRCHAQALFDVPAEAFRPRPKVDATLVRLTPRTQGGDEICVARFQRAARLAFASPRKTLARALGDAALVARAGLDPTARAQTLTVAAIVALARAL